MGAFSTEQVHLPFYHEQNLLAKVMTQEDLET